MGITERIREIEAEMARTQRNKATEHHLGLLKAKLAKLRTQLMEPDKGAGGAGKGEGFDVQRKGNARVALIGFPSVGKSTLLSRLTKTHSEQAAYAFTTLTCIPGVIHYQGAQIQLLDLPGIIEGAAVGKGRGRQVIAVARTSDLILMMLDAANGDVQRALLEKELETMGIRLNRKKPNIYFKIKKAGGIIMSASVPLTHMDEKLCGGILQQYKIHNAEVLFREDCTSDDLIDVIEGNRKYMRCLYVYNKIDTYTVEMVDELARAPHSMVISCQWGIDLDDVTKRMWEYCDLIRLYTKKRGGLPDFEEPVVLPRGVTVEEVCKGIHKSLLERFKFALVWGVSAKHEPQRVGLSHVLEDEDVIQIVARV